MNQQENEEQQRRLQMIADFKAAIKNTPKQGAAKQLYDKFKDGIQRTTTATERDLPNSGTREE